MNSQKQNSSQKLQLKHYNQDFTDQISKYPQLIPFIFNDISSDSDQNQEVMAKLLNFYSTTILESVPTFFDLSEDMIYFYSSDNLKIHTVIYLSHKVWKMKIKSYQEKVSLFSTLIYFLHSFLDNYDENKVVIKFQKLTEYFYNERPSITFLNKIIQQIKPVSHLSKHFNPNNKKLYSLFIHYISQNNDNYIHCLQHVFEAAISSNHFIFYSEINTFIQSHQNIKSDNINSMIYNLSKKIAIHFGINTSKEVRILNIALMRYIYDRIYPSTYHTYFGKKVPNIIQNVSNIAFKKLCVNIRLFPHSIRPSKQFCSILRNDPYYRKAIDYLEDIQFMTNPIDMLFCVQRSLKAIDEAAIFYSQKKDSKPFNFHETVSIFLAVTISSEIPEIIEIHQFINNHFFNDNLFPEMCAVRAAFESCILKLYQLNKENPNKNFL